MDVVLSTAVSHGGRDRDGCEEKENLKITVPLKGGAGRQVVSHLAAIPTNSPAKAASG